MLEIMSPTPSNFIPLPYRQVSVQRVEWALDRKTITSYLQGKDCYKATRFIIFRSGEQSALVAVDPADNPNADLFIKIRDFSILAEPQECVWIHDETVDTGNRPALAQASLKHKVEAQQTLIVEGKFGHVNFYHKPAPMILRVVDQTPPSPSRLSDLVRQVLAFEEFPPVVVLEEVIDIVDIAHAHQSPAHLFPCHASGIKGPARTLFLDDRPTKEPWMLVGCKRTGQIYRHVYGAEVQRAETCPRELTTLGKEPTIVRCCLLESTVEMDATSAGKRAVVPWGGDVHHVSKALHELFSSTKA